MITSLFTMLSILRQRRGDQRGASAVEYGLLVALIAAVIILAVLALGNTLEGVFSDTDTCLTDPTEANCD